MANTVDRLLRGIERARAAGDEESAREIETELNRIQAQAAPAPQTAAQPSAGPSTQPIDLTQIAREAAAAGQPIAMPYGVPGSPITPAGAQEFLSAASRQIPPALTSMRMGMSSTPPGLIANVAATGLTAGLAELAARFGEGKDVTSPEALGKAGRAAIEYGAPGPILGGVSRFGGQNVFQMGGRAVFGLQGGMSKAAQASALTGGSILSGREAEALISGKPATKLTRENVFDEVVYPSLLSGALTGTAQTFGRLGDIVSTIGARRAFLQNVGGINPTLGALLPERFGQIELAMAGPGASGISQQRAAMGQQASNAIKDQFDMGNYASNEAVAAYVNPRIQGIAAAEDTYTKANAAYEQADAAYRAAREATYLTPAERAMALQDAQEQVYRAMQVRANAILTSRFGVPLEKSGKAEEVTKIIGDLFNLRSNVAKDKYAPLRATGAVFSIDDIEEAARMGMGSYADTEQGKLLLSGIRNYRGDGVVTTPSRPNPAARFDPTAPATLPEVVSYDLEGVRQMRERLSDIIDAQPDGVVTRMEKEAGKAYKAVNESIRTRLEQIGGPQLTQQWDAARDYWSSSFRAMESDDKALRLLMRGRATPGDIDAVAGSLVGGNAGTIKAISKFVDSVSEADPEQKKLALSTIGSAVSNSLLNKHFGGGTMDWNGLFDDVLRMSGVQGMQSILPVEKFGLGSRSQIAQSRAVIRDFSKRGLTDEAIGEAMASPLFTQAIEAGLATPRALTQALAQAEYKQRVMSAQGLLAAGLKDKANKEFAKADSAFRIAGYDKAQAAAALQGLQLDPAYQVLTGQTKLTNAPEVTAGRIGDLLMRTEEGTAKIWLSYLAKTDPGNYDIIATNTLANFLERHLKTTGEVNFNSLRQQFSNRNTEFQKLSRIFPSETMEKLGAMPDLVRIMDDTLSARPVSDSGLRRFAQIFGLGVGTARAVQSGSIPTQALAVQGAVKTAGALISNGAYHIVAHQLLNPSRSLITPGSSFAEAVARMPMQQAVILMNNQRLAAEMARADEESKRPRQ